MLGRTRWLPLALLALGFAACDDGAPLFADPLEDAAPTPPGRADAALDMTPDAMPDAMPDAFEPPDAEPRIPYDPICENLTDTHCAYPWPSDRWLTPDPDTATGYRLTYIGETMPANTLGQTIDPAPYARRDGFSPGSQLLTLFPRAADLSDIAGPDGVEASTGDDFPTVVLDLETGEKVPHWIENDARADADDETALFIRPASRLLPDRSYGVAIRGLRDADGALLPTPQGFANLRSGETSEVGAFDDRRAGFEELFTALDAAGFERDTLQMAWRFHTESEQSMRGTLRAMRDDAVERLGPGGLGCTITDVEEDDDEHILRRVSGTVTTPWYLDGPRQPAAIVTDADGQPQFVETREVEFTALVPRIAADGPVRLVHFGHGLFGNAADTLDNGGLRRAANTLGAVIVGTDWAGMSTSDLAFLATALTDVSRFWYLGEMLQQGVINQIALARTMLGVCRDDPDLAVDGRPAFHTDDPAFFGVSQGSILGGAVMALHPDITRGVLAVGGSDFSFMIERSIHFDRRFELLLGPNYPRRIDTALLMALSQHVWDRGESGPWLDVLGDPAEGRQVLYLIAENDAQVPNLSSHRAARQAGWPVVSSSTHVPWAVEVRDPPVEGSAYLAMDVGDRLPPGGNLSPLEDDGGHGGVPVAPEALETIAGFVESGVIDPPCMGPCRLVE